MNNERFYCDNGSRIIIDNKTGLHYIMTLDWECNLVTKLLNNLANENDYLKEFQKKVTSVIENKLGDNVCNDYKMEVLKEIWDELNLEGV